MTPEELEAYKQATNEKYNFLYVDTNDDTYRCNFNQQFVI